MKNPLSQSINRWTSTMFILLSPLAAQATVGQIVEDFELPLFDSTSTYSETHFKLSEQSGKVIVLEWFGWWCPFCPPAAEAFQKQVKNIVGKQNDNGVPIEYINLHVNGVDNAGISQFITTFNLETVVMDDDRTVFNKFHDSSIQPFFAIINGVEGSPSEEQWEVIYEHNGYGGGSFPGTAMVNAINSIELGATTTDPGDGDNDDSATEPVKPEEAPQMSVIQPYSTLEATNQLKDTAEAVEEPSAIGVIYDANFPNIYSFSFAQLQRNNEIEESVDTDSKNAAHMGWFYVHPDFTQLHDGILAYDYYDTQWIWISKDVEGSVQILGNPQAGEAGWLRLPSEVDIPGEENLSGFISELSVPTTPEGLTQDNPFTSLTALDGNKDLKTEGFQQLGVINDTDFPLVQSDKLLANQSGTNAGWAYIFAPASSIDTGVLAYLYEGNQWVWFPKSQANWYFGFAYPQLGFSGWEPNRVPEPILPGEAEIANFESQQDLPESSIVDTFGSGNPFWGINPDADSTIKDSTELGKLNLGWIDDSQYPFVYSYDLAAAFEGNENAGWLYFSDSSTVMASGLLVYIYGNSSWHWIPVGLEGMSVNLSNPNTGISGWNQYPSEGVKPSLESLVVLSSESVPSFTPEPLMASPFSQISEIGMAKNTQLTRSTADWGLGNINDSNYPYIYSYDYAQLQQETVTENGESMTQPLENAGWFYVLEHSSAPEKGLLLYNIADMRWQWIPANGSGRYFNLSNPQSGKDGWFRLLD